MNSSLSNKSGIGASINAAILLILSPVCIVVLSFFKYFHGIRFPNILLNLRKLTNTIHLGV